jgi:Secretion system C-terminal sorting domain
MGGIAGPIDPSFTQTAMDIDYIRVYQNITPDTQAPTNFTASVGAITGSSVELVLNATDDSGNVSYLVDYGSGTTSTYSPSGTQKSFIINNLNQNTNYTFNVSAKDATGNVAGNNPIVLTAKTTTILQCTGTETQSTQGSFSLGYKYTFETIGTDVKINFELLDTNKAGVVAYLWKQSPFSESQMSNVTGNIFTKTITGQTIGSTISYACKFAYAGGLSVTKYISYVVGSSCSLGVETVSELNQFCYPNPVDDVMQLQLLDNHNKITLTDVLGRKLIDEDAKSSHKIDMSAFKSGMYFLKIDNSFGIQNLKIIKK